MALTEAAECSVHLAGTDCFVMKPISILQNTPCGNRAAVVLLPDNQQESVSGFNRDQFAHQFARTYEIDNEPQVTQIPAKLEVSGGLTLCHAQPKLLPTVKCIDRRVVEVVVSDFNRESAFSEVG